MDLDDTSKDEIICEEIWQRIGFGNSFVETQSEAPEFLWIDESGNNVNQDIHLHGDGGIFSSDFGDAQNYFHSGNDKFRSEDYESYYCYDRLAFDPLWHHLRKLILIVASLKSI